MQEMYLCDALSAREPLCECHQPVLVAFVANQAVRDAVQLDGFQVKGEDGDGAHIQYNLQPINCKKKITDI